MRIIHFLNTNKFSGAENVVCQLAEEFGKTDEVVYCSPKGEIEEVLKRRGVDYLPLKKLSVKEIKRAVKEFEPDIIHAHDFRAGLLANLACKKVPVISHLHNNCPWLKNFGLKSLLFWYTAKKSRCILTVSSSVMDEYIFGEKFKGKTVVVGNPVNVSEIRTKVNGDLVKKYDLVFCGRMTKQKDPLLFVELVEKLKKKFPGIKTVMLGDGEMKGEVKDRIVEKDLQNNIEMLGFVEDPIQYMAESKALVMTSSWEGFGLVAVEAMAVGTPVVANAVGGLVDLVTDEAGKLCSNELDFCNEIERVLTDENYYRKKVNGALKQSDELNNSEEYIKNLRSIYVKALR